MKSIGSSGFGLGKWLGGLLAALGSIFVFFLQTEGIQADQLGDFTYTDDGASITITDYSDLGEGNQGPENPGVLIIPETINEKPVTAIGPAAFMGCAKLKSVTVPSGVTIVPYRMFYSCVELTTVVLSGAVTSIGQEAFGFCPKLSSLGVPESVRSFGVGTFFQCSSLTSFVIPAGVTVIPSSLFWSCSGLQSVTIPPSVTMIGPNAFRYCSALTSIGIPAGVIQIQTKAFANCTGLSTVAIPSSVTTLGTEVFIYCSNLESITVVEPNSAFTSLDGVLFNNDMTSLKVYPAGKPGSVYQIPGGVTSLGTKAFFAGSKLVGVILPAAIESVGAEAFSECTSLAWAYFTGDAPFMGSLVFNLAAQGFTILYPAGATGYEPDEFGEPGYWNGYPAIPVTITPPQPLSDWLALYGLPPDADLEVDANGDGVNLLTAHAFGLNPNQNLSSALPKPQFTATEMSLTYPLAASGVAYTVESSPDLRNWSSAGVTYANDPGALTQTATVARSGPCGFLRIVLRR